MRLLLDDRLAPITSDIGFIEAPAAEAVEAFLAKEDPIHAPYGRSFTRTAVAGTLEEVLQRLLPLTSVHRLRHLFIPTASRWTAYTDNGHHGTDVFSAVSSLALALGCRGLRVLAAPDTIEGEFREARGRYGGLALEVYGPRPNPILNYERVVSLINDGGRWSFDASGTPFPFEEVERYAERRKRDRFTFEMLERYLAELGLAPFREEFYLPESGGPAWLVERHGPRPPGLRELTLAEARGGF